MKTERELYDIYSKWTGELHFFAVRDLRSHLDCEYFPNDYQFKVYSGYAEEFTTSGGIPGLSRPQGECSETIRLLRPLDNPSQEDLDLLFKQICLAAARVLKIKVGRKLLRESSPVSTESKALAGERPELCE
jgi:hypothetical protein